MTNGDCGRQLREAEVYRWKVVARVNQPLISQSARELRAKEMIFLFCFLDGGRREREAVRPTDLSPFESLSFRYRRELRALW